MTWWTEKKWNCHKCKAWQKLIYCESWLIIWRGREGLIRIMCYSHRGSWPPGAWECWASCNQKPEQMGQLASETWKQVDRLPLLSTAFCFLNGIAPDKIFCARDNIRIRVPRKWQWNKFIFFLIYSLGEICLYFGCLYCPMLWKNSLKHDKVFCLSVDFWLPQKILPQWCQLSNLWLTSLCTCSAVNSWIFPVAFPEYSSCSAHAPWLCNCSCGFLSEDTVSWSA